MDEHDLWTLGQAPLGPAGTPRPVGDVLRRGTGLRRRAAAARASAAVVMVGLVAGVGVLAARPGQEADVVVGPDRPDVQDLPTMPPQFCDPPSGPATLDEMDGLRLIPNYLPDGVEFTGVDPARERMDGCAEVDPALVLRLEGTDGTLAAEMVLEGPFSAPYPGGDEITLEPTDLRGREASRVRTGVPDATFLGFAWTEVDGASWLLTAHGADEATVRAVAEALELEAAPIDADPVAVLPDDAMPDGYAATWQARGLPVVEGPERLVWQLVINPPAPEGCTITISTTRREAPPGEMSAAGPGVRADDRVAVRGTEGFAIEEGGIVVLDWQETPGVVGRLMCNGDIDEAVRVADSLEEVEPDDPRIQPGPG
jgi:hypothetical protein